jgi:Protein of unknown function (DUF2911)
MVWRLGANKETELVTDAELLIGNKKLQAGKYILSAKKVDGNSWVLTFYPRTAVWGDPMGTNASAELPLRQEQVNDSTDKLLISLYESEGKANIRIHWGTAVLSGSFAAR